MLIVTTGFVIGTSNFMIAKSGAVVQSQGYTKNAIDPGFKSLYICLSFMSISTKLFVLEAKKFHTNVYLNVVHTYIIHYVSIGMLYRSLTTLLMSSGPMSLFCTSM